MPKIFKMMKKLSGDRFLLTAFLFLTACQSIHLPFVTQKTSPKEANENVTPSDQFAPGAFSPSCKPGEISVIEGNILAVGMRMASDGKWCALEMKEDTGGKYQSFGVPISPEHGKAYLYDGNDGITYIAYQPEFGFEGKDHFRVFLLPGEGRPRKNVEISVEVSMPQGIVSKRQS